jgi:AraC-like DNA-binding protein
MRPETSVRAWQPRVAGIAEVLHAHFTDHAYPSHTHDTWTLLIVDTGAVRYGLDRHEHGAVRSLVTLLPPHVPHDGRSVAPTGFRKRVVYLEPDALDLDRTGVAVDHPGWVDGPLRDGVSRLHAALLHPGDAFEAESRLTVVTDRLRRHLSTTDVEPPVVRDASVARRLRDLLDDPMTSGITLEDAATRLGVSPTHLVRAFGTEYGIPPHRYLVGRRLDRARRMLLSGLPPALTASEVGFYDQAHLTRQFRRFLGTTPAAYARSGG